MSHSTVATAHVTQSTGEGGGGKKKKIKKKKKKKKQKHPARVALPENYFFLLQK